VNDIAEEISNASKQYSVVFTSGGVGPTHDDVTYEAVAKAFELKLELHQELFNIYTQLIPGQHEVKRLAIVPNSCKIINIDSGIHIFFKSLFLSFSFKIYILFIQDASVKIIM